MNFFQNLTVLVSFQLITTSVLAQEVIYCMDIDNPNFSLLEVFNEDINNKKIILIGEIHYMHASYVLQAELLIYLNKFFGIKHLLIEYGIAEAWLYNQYLNSGDPNYLMLTSSGLSGHEKFFTSLKKLYQYNSTLESDKKLIIHGLDFEREPGLTASLYQLLTDFPKNSPIGKFRSELKIRLDTIQITRDNKDYILFLKERVSTLNIPDSENTKIINSILNNASFFSNFSQRDKHMTQAFMDIDTTNEIYMGQFGFAHTNLSGHFSLVNRLSNLEQYHNNILVTNMIAVDSKISDPFEDLSKCPVFLFKTDSSEGKFNFLSKSAHWALILKDQPKYLPIRTEKTH